MANAPLDKPNQENNLLENLFDNDIKLDETQKKKTKRVFDKVVPLVIDTAKQVSDEFKELYREIYYGGSYFDRLKVKSTDFEFDLNIVFQTPKTSCPVITELGDDVRRPNFGSILCQRTSSEAWNNLIVTDRQGNLAVSPKKMFKLLHRSIDQALQILNKQVTVDNETVTVTRSTGAPVILNVRGPGVKFTVDLVPAFKFAMSDLGIKCADLKTRVGDIITDFGCNVKTFMAIALKNADSDRFEVDFHDVERGILSATGGCVYKVIMLIKYLRDLKGGTMTNLWSHLLKTQVMHHVLRQDMSYWNNSNLQTCFIDCLTNLWIGLEKGLISDIFFPEFNMLDRIDGKMRKQLVSWLDGMIRKYHRSGSIAAVFPDLAIASDVQGVLPYLQQLSISQSAELSQINNTKEKIKPVCEPCGMTFTGVESRDQHVQSKRHLAKVEPLPMNKASISSIQTVKDEVNSTITCQVKFSGVESREEHLRSKRHLAKVTNNTFGDQKLSCDLCGVSFSGEESQGDHMRSKKHLAKVSSNQLVGDSTETKSMLSCDLCGLSFTGVESQEEHLRSKKHLAKVLSQTVNAFDESRLSCDPCGLTFSGIDSQGDHMRSKKHITKVADQDMRLNREEKHKLSCSPCGVSFSGEESQEEHMRSKKHMSKINQSTDAPELACQPCGMVFTGAKSMEEHLKSKKHMNKVA